MKVSDWHSPHGLNPKSYICGFCGDKVGAHQGYFVNADIAIYICPGCGEPTYFNWSKQTPGAVAGRQIEKLPKDISEIYKEIRETIKNGQYTASILLGRKLIMHLAVDVTGAKEGLSFVEYIDCLKESGFVPPKSIKYLEKIKDLGNEKNHELKIGNTEEAQNILGFVEVLLIFMYEYSDEEDVIDPTKTQAS